MTMIPLDVQSDGSGARLYNLNKDGLIPDWVKTAGADVYPTDALPDEHFAHASRRLLPCHTKAATALSAAYFFADPTLYPDAGLVEERLRRKMAVYDVPVPTFVEEQEEIASEPEYAYRDGDRKAAPVTDEASYKDAVNYFHEYRGEMTKEAATDMSHFLVRSPFFATADTTTRKNLMKAAKLGYASKAHVEELFERMGNADLVGQFPKLAKKAAFYGPKELAEIDHVCRAANVVLPDAVVEHTMDDVQAARFDRNVKKAKQLSLDEYLDLYGEAAFSKMWADMLNG